MLFRRQVEQIIEHKKSGEPVKNLRWWDLSLIGTGAVIGAGFFLGTSLSIMRAGPSIIFLYILGGVTAYLVFAALAAMSVNDPQEGSFRVYARKAFGPSMGFVSGWMYWLAGVLIMSSEIAALSIFTRFWFPTIPLWIFAALYAGLGLGINLLGVKDFGKIESLFGLLKTSSLVIFILFALVFALGVITTPAGVQGTQMGQLAAGGWSPQGLSGTWAAMIFVLFSYGGIEVMGIMSSELKKRREIGRAGRMMLLALTLIYTVALAMVFVVFPWRSITAAESPFVIVLAGMGYSFVDSILNLLIISAAFSTMVGALFAVTNVMVSLAEDHDAPSSLAQRNRKEVPINSLALTGFGMAGAVVLSFLLPGTVYEYITTAAGVMLILNWLIILSSQMKNRAMYVHSKGSAEYRMPGFPYTSYFVMGIIALTILGALLFSKERIGVLVSLAIASIIFLAGRWRESGRHLISIGLPLPARKRMPKE